MGIASLGALAGGLGQGVERGLRIAGDQEDRAWQRDQRERQRKLQTDADAEAGALRSANEAGAQVMRQYQQEWQKQQPGPTMDGAQVQANPFQPTPQMMLSAGRARTDKLLQLTGPTETWMKTWAQDEAMRGQVRGQSAMRVKQALASGADVTGPLTEFFSTIDDGFEVKGVQRTAGPDGKPVLAVQRANRYTGQIDPQPLLIPADKLVNDLDMMAANPADVAKHSMAMTLEAVKQAGSMALEDKRQKGRMTLADVNNTSSEKRVERTASATETAARTRAAAAGKSADAEQVRALAQERTSVDNDVRTLVQQLKDARPTDRPQIQSDLAEARKRAEDVRNRLRSLSSGGAATPEASPQGSKMDAIMKDAEAQGLSTFDVQVDGKPRVSVSRGGAAAQQPQPMPKSRAELKPGAIYQTSRGPAKWNGTAFEAQ